MNLTRDKIGWAFTQCGEEQKGRLSDLMWNLTSVVYMLRFKVTDLFGMLVSLVLYHPY